MLVGDALPDLFGDGSFPTSVLPGLNGFLGGGDGYRQDRETDHESGQVQREPVEEEVDEKFFTHCRPLVQHATPQPHYATNRT